MVVLNPSSRVIESEAISFLLFESVGSEQRLGKMEGAAKLV